MWEVIRIKELSKQFYHAGKKGEERYLLRIQGILSELYDYEKDFWTTIKTNVERIMISR